MTTVAELMVYLEKLAPFHLQEAYDNSGLIVGNPLTPISGVLVALDAIEEVIDEAIQNKCNVVLSHHPIVFKGLKSFTGKDYVERAVIKAIKNDIALISIHTNLDNVLDHGVNTKIAEKLGLTDLQPLKPIIGNTDYVTGSGLIGALPEKKETLVFLDHVKTTMAVGSLKYTEIIHQHVQSVAVCGGSGSFLLKEAINAGADLFITSDFKYHEFFDANGKIIIADIGHYESEQYTIDLLHDALNQNFSTFAAHCTKVNTNPVKYL